MDYNSFNTHLCVTNENKTTWLTAVCGKHHHLFCLGGTGGFLQVAEESSGAFHQTRASFSSFFVLQKVAGTQSLRVPVHTAAACPAAPGADPVGLGVHPVNRAQPNSKTCLNLRLYDHSRVVCCSHSSLFCPNLKWNPSAWGTPALPLGSDPG